MWGETTRAENRGETTRGETTRGETYWGRNVLLPVNNTYDQELQFSVNLWKCVSSVVSTLASGARDM